MIKLEALAQTSGQAQYIIDKPDLPNQLHACFVIAEAAPGSVITSINHARAVAMDGVVAFYSAKDIPGINSITALSFGLAPEVLFCTDTVSIKNTIRHWNLTMTLTNSSGVVLNIN